MRLSLVDFRGRDVLGLVKEVGGRLMDLLLFDLGDLRDLWVVGVDTVVLEGYRPPLCFCGGPVEVKGVLEFGGIAVGGPL